MTRRRGEGKLAFNGLLDEGGPIKMSREQLKLMLADRNFRLATYRQCDQEATVKLIK
jgi:hypothetical protein